MVKEKQQTPHSGDMILAPMIPSTGRDITACITTEGRILWNRRERICDTLTSLDKIHFVYAAKVLLLSAVATFHIVFSPKTSALYPNQSIKLVSKLKNKL